MTPITTAWLTADLRNIMAALAISVTSANPPPSPDWLDGYMAALGAVSVAIGTSVPVPNDIHTRLLAAHR